MILEFHPEVEEEISYSYHWYEEKSKGLGNKSISEIQNSLERIKANPRANQIVEKEIRRSLISKFPFGILYATENDTVYVLAVMHLKKKPFYWLNRMK